MALVIAFLVVLNLVSLLRHHHHGAEVSNAELFGALLFDVAALTIQLYLSGGATNPFISLYLLQIALGAVLLQAWSSWALVVISSLCFVLLIYVYRAAGAASRARQDSCSSCISWACSSASC